MAMYPAAGGLEDEREVRLAGGVAMAVVDNRGFLNGEQERVDEGKQDHVLHAGVDRRQEDEVNDDPVNVRVHLHPALPPEAQLLAQPEQPRTVHHETRGAQGAHVRPGGP